MGHGRKPTWLTTTPVATGPRLGHQICMAPIPDQRNRRQQFDGFAFGREKKNLLELKGGFVGKPLGKTLLKRLNFLVGYRYQSKSALVAPHIAGEMMSCGGLQIKSHDQL